MLAGGLVAWIGILLAIVCALSAILLPRYRHQLSVVAAGLLLAVCACLLFYLLNDDFSYRYVWLYSTESLPWYLKLANLWGGEEGTLLLLATLITLAATRLVHYKGWAGPGALLIGAVFALGAAIWNPFVATPDSQLPSQGMNAHLLRVWMALHPPLLFIAYTWILAPVGAALQALASGQGDWIVIARRYSRSAWLVLSAGLAAGMWWAYEDYTFGQFWHWDPVQTSVFVVWALLTAQVHGLRYYRADGLLARTLPILALLTGVAVLVSMLVTRNSVLASSHRYVGDTSFPILLLMALGLGLATVVAWLYSLRRSLRTKSAQGETLWMIRIAIIVFVLIAAVAGLHLAQAYVSAFLEWPRPESLKPFFETLTRWTDSQELAELRRVFAQWDVDNFGLNHWLAPLGLLAGLFGGHAFLRLRKRCWAWSVTIGVGVIALLIAWFLHPLNSLYTGTGMTSHRTVEQFFWLDAMMIAAGYLILSALWWSLRMGRYWRRRIVHGYLLPTGLIHLGIMFALLGAVSASVLDTYAQKPMNYPEDFGKVQRFPDGYTVQIEMPRSNYVADGGLREGLGFQAVAQVHLWQQQKGVSVPIGTGTTLYRDARVPLSGEQGPVRQMCEILDYRYARYTASPNYRLDPFIQRGFWRDVQVWLPALDYALMPEATAVPKEGSVTVVIKTYPLISWLWLGLVLTLLAAGMISLFAWREHRAQA